MTASLHERIEIHRALLPHEPIGEGGMGEVIAAIDPDTGQRFAIKFLRREHLTDARMVERFREEAEITASIDHAGGIPVFGLGTTSDGRPFYVMRRLAGRSLRELLDERGGRVADLLWRERLVGIFVHVCEVVGFAHVQGIVHRDLKPEHILVDEEGSVTVADWGLAKRAGLGDSSAARATRTVAGDVLGSPGYMSPEQASGNAADARPPADVFALGAILYEILTGKQAFAAATQRESVLASIYREVPDPRKSVASLWFAHSLVAVCRKALDKEPAGRYRNAQELAGDLRALRHGHPARAVRPSGFERLSWAVKRRPILFGLAAAALGAVAVALLFVGAQLRIDSRLASKAFAQIARGDVEVEQLGQRSRELDRRLDDAPSPGARRALELERAEVNARQLLIRLDSIYLLQNVLQLRFIRPDPRLGEMMKSRALDALRSAVELGEPGIAKAFAAVLTGRRTEANLDEAETARLRALSAEADRAFDAAVKRELRANRRDQKGE